MNSVERVKAICKERKIPLSKLERDLCYGNGYISQLRKGVFPSDRLIEIAEYLQISPSYILNGAEKIAPADVGKCAIGDDINLTKAELDLIQKFRQLDQRGQSAVLNTLEHEYSALSTTLRVAARDGSYQEIQASGKMQAELKNKLNNLPDVPEDL